MSKKVTYIKPVTCFILGNHDSMLNRKKLFSLKNVFIILAIVASQHNATASYIGDFNLGLENFKIQDGGYEDNCLGKSRAYSGSGCTRTAESIHPITLGVHALWEAASWGHDEPVEDPYDIIEALQGTISELQGTIQELGEIAFGY